MSYTTPLLVAQLTDTHLFAHDEGEMLGVATMRSLQSVLNTLKELDPQPQALLLTGDLSQDESVESYERLRDLVTPLQIATHWIPGNHDVLAIAQHVLHTPTISLGRTFEAGGWQFILLNSQVEGCVHGRLTEETLEWLEQRLMHSSHQPTLIALHHPPATIGSDWMDEISLLNPEAFYRIVDHHPQVKVVLFGHIHQEFDTERNGVRYLGTPSTCVQFKPRSREIELDELKPGFRLLQLHPDGRCETVVKRVTYR